MADRLPFGPGRPAAAVGDPRRLWGHCRVWTLRAEHQQPGCHPPDCGALGLQCVPDLHPLRGTRERFGAQEARRGGFKRPAAHLLDRRCAWSPHCRLHHERSGPWRTVPAHGNSAPPDYARHADPGQTATEVAGRT